MRLDGSTVLETASPRANGHPACAPNGHCATGNTFPASRDASDHVIAADKEAGSSVAEVESTGCFACIALCHAKDSRKSSK